MKELEAKASYENGYDKDSLIIKNFWEVIHSFSIEDQKKFLCFCTGTDRVPIGGLSNIKLII